MAATAYTINTNASANEELGIQWATSQYNASSIAANPNFVPLTSTQYLKQVLNDKIREMKLAYKQKLRDDAANGVVFDVNA